MPVVSLAPGYSGPTRDAVENFHGNQLVYVHWEGHLNFCSAIALPLPPEMPFEALADDVIPGLYGVDPAWRGDELAGARWMLDGADWAPASGQSLAAQGVGHKSLIRFWTRAADRG